MSRVKRVLGLAGIVVLALTLLIGCARLFWDTTGQSGWYIRLNIGNLGAKAIGVGEYDVTQVDVELFAPGETLPFYTLTWYAGDDPVSELIPVSEQGEYRIAVTHVGDDNGEPVEAEEWASFDITAMVITVITVTPGAVGVIEVDPGEIVPEEPINLTGYWDWYFTLTGSLDEQGPVLLYLHQEDLALYGSVGFTGSISGSDFDLESSEVGVSMSGTVSESQDELNGIVTSSQFGTGTFRMVPSEAPFGLLVLEGNVGGEPISLDTEFALATGGEVEYWDQSATTHFEANHQTHERDVTVWMSVNGEVPEIGEGQQITYNVPDVWFTLTWLYDGQGVWEYLIEVDSGSLTLTRFDDSGIAGNFSIFDTQGGSDWLSGSFDLSWWEEWQPGDD